MYSAIEINILALLICVGLFIRIKKYKLEVLGTNLYIDMLTIMAFILSIEIVILFMESGIVASNYWLHMIVVSLYFFGQTVLPFILLLFNIKMLRKDIYSKVRIFISIPMLIEVVVLILNIYSPFAFTVNESGEYFRLEKFLFINIFAFIYIFADVFVATIGYLHDKKNAIKKYCLLFNISIVIEALLSFLVYGIELYPMITVSLLFLYLVIFDKRSVELDEEASTDTLTGVGNVKAYQKMINVLEEQYKKGKEKNYSIVVFDINNLKTTNDKLGHAIGNKLIVATAECIRECFKDCQVFRIGGDEFVAIIEGEQFDVRYKLFECFKNKIDNYEIDLENGKLELKVAVGMADYCSNTNESYIETFRMADRAMYNNKYQMKHV